MRIQTNTRWGFAWLLCLAFQVLIIPQDHALGDDYSQTFESWPGTPWTTIKSSTNSNWILKDVFVRGSGFWAPPASGTYACWLDDVFDDDGETGLPWVRTPLLTNGVGKLSFALRTKLASPSIVLEVQSSTNGSDWALVETLTNSSTLWSPSTITINSYVPMYLRISSTTNLPTAGDGQYLGLDDVAITYPPAYVIITNTGITTIPPYANTPVQIASTITPKAFASNIQSRVYHTTGLEAPPFTSFVTMSSTGGNYHATTEGIPAVSKPGVLVRYYVHAEFTGPTAESLTPTNDPPGSGTYSYIVRASPFLSPYTNMTIAGTATAPMRLAANNLWLGVVTNTGTLINPTNRFVSGASSWGDTDQNVFSTPVYGIANSGGTAISISETITNHLAYSFNTTSLVYSIQKAAYTDFDTWTNANIHLYGAYTNAEGWSIVNGRLTNTAGETNYALSGRACILKYDQVAAGPRQFVQSPYRPAGLGTLNLWYRSWTNTPAGFVVQKSATGTDGTWVDVSPDTSWVTNVLAIDYLFLSLPVGDRNSHYIRILNTNVLANSTLCLDEITLTDPGATVAITENPRAPLTPSLGETKPLSISVTFQGDASDMACTVYYQPQGMGWQTLAMTPSDVTNFSVSVPPTPPGPVSYYYKCTFSGFGASTTYYPGGAPGSFLSYNTSPSPSAYRIQNFDSWAGAPWTTILTSTNAGWIIKDGMIRTTAFWVPPASSPHSAWLDDIFDDDGEEGDPFLQSPLMTNGVGSVYFACRSKLNSAPQTFDVQISSDGTNWTTYASFENQDSSTWTTNRCIINTYEDVFVRILKTFDNLLDGQFLGLDNILITPPPADVTIDDIWLSPGYPAKLQDVTLYCDITDVSTNFPTWNRVASLYYQHSLGSSGVVSAAYSGGNTYAGTVPGLPAGTVSYYFKCLFDGFYYTNGTYSERMSPAFSPDAWPTNAAPATRHTYTIREYKSDFDYFEANVASNAPLELTHLDDFTWQGIFSFGRSGSYNAPLTLSGVSWFTGSNYDAQAWSFGDTNQTRTAIPLVGTLLPDSGALVLPGSLTGQYVIRFNEADGSYSVQKCVYQDFEGWIADDYYFVDSLNSGEVQTYRQAFDHWATNPISPPPYADGFETWGPAFSGWTNELQGLDTYWKARDCKIVNEVSMPAAGNSKALVLRDDLSYGSVWLNTLPADGIGTLEFDYRCQENNWRPTIHSGSSGWTNSMIEATMYATNIPANTNGTLLGYSYHSLYSRATLGEADYYEMRITQDEPAETYIGFYKKLAGTYVNNGNPVAGYDLSSLAGYQPLTNPAAYRFVTVNQSGGRVLLEAYRNDTRLLLWADTGVGGSVISAPGTMGVNTKDASLLITKLEGGWAQAESFEGWPSSTTPPTNYTNDNWIVHRPYSLVAGSGVWLNSYSAGDPAYVISPLLPHGFSAVMLNYERPSGDATAVRIEWSTNLSTWTLMTWTNVVINGAVNNNITIPGVTNLPVSNVYVRILNYTNASAKSNRLRLDNISIRPATTIGLYEDFSDVVANGWSGTGPWWTTKTNLYARPGYAEAPLQFDLQLARGDTLTGDLMGDAPWNTIATYTNSNTEYQHVAHTINLSEYPSGSSQRIFARIKHTATAASLVLNNLDFNVWHGQYQTDTNGWKSSESWITRNPAGTGGVYYEYYQGTWTMLPDFDSLTPLKTGWGRNFDITPRLRNDNFAFRFTSMIYIPTAGSWVFYLTSDDGSKLYIDGTEVINHDGGHGMTEKSGVISLSAGWHPIVVTHFQGTGGYGLEVRYAGGTISKQLIPDIALPGDNFIELRRSRAYANTNQYVQSPWVTNGIGGVSFYYNSINGTNDTLTFELQMADSRNTSYWYTVTARTNAVEDWTKFSYFINTKYPLMSLRVLHSSTNSTAGLLMDNMQFTDYFDRDEFTWQGYNAKITDKETTRLLPVKNNTQGGYLNHSPTLNVVDPMAPFTADNPFIQSANLTNGIGEISFWYRNWGGALPAGTLIVQKAPIETTNYWETMFAISNITTETFTYFTTNFYDISNHYVRIYSQTNGSGRICLDNILITGPYGADISITNLTITPSIPLFTNVVSVEVTLYDYFLNPSNTSVELCWYQGTNVWGSWPETNIINMTIVGGDSRVKTYRTVSEIPERPVDTVIQYYPKVTFNGLFSEKASPKRYRQFASPEHYYPTDLNSGKTPSVPYYIVFSCLPGYVWINEINVVDISVYPYSLMDYVELCGQSGIDVGNWWIDVYDTDYNLLTTYKITAPSTVPNDADGYGFHVFGDSSTTGRDTTMTNLTAFGKALPTAGGIWLRRSMGAIEHAIAYETFEGEGAANLLTDPSYRFVYAGIDDLFADVPLPLTGTGSQASEFTWESFSSAGFTPGAINDGQTLIPRSDPPPPPPVIEITAFWMNSVSVNLVSTSTNGWYPSLWYSTNLLTTNWFSASFSYAPTNVTNYHIWSTIMTNLPSCFYRVTSTN